MQDPAAVLSLGDCIGGATTAGAGVLVIRWAASRWVVWPLLAVTAFVAGLMVVSALHGGVWHMGVHGLLAIAIVALWSHHLGVRRDRPSRLAVAFVRWRASRGVLRGPEGRRIRTIDQLRAEYGQNVLDDAARDPILDRLLSAYEQRIAALAREAGERLDALSATVFANRYLESLSDPGRPAGGTPPYAGYSRHMLVIAATCRLAQRLPEMSTPSAGR